MNILITAVFANSICFGVSPQEIPLKDLEPFNPIIVEQLPTEQVSANSIANGYKITATGIDWVCNWRNNHE